MHQPSRKIHLLYHELRPNDSRYSYVVGTEEFKKHIDLFVQLRQGAESSVWPEVTFDDGHISNFNFALPILQSRGFKASFFITAGWTGRRPGYMGWSELRQLHQAGHIIGAHGWTHTLLTHCSERELLTELNTAKLTLEDKLGTSVTAMSLPGGRFNRRVLAACHKAGYTQVFTSIPGAELMPLGTMVGRLNIRGDMDLKWISDLFQLNSKAIFRLRRQYRIKAAAKTLLGDGLYEKLWALVNRKEPDLEEAATNEDNAYHQ